MTSAHRDVYRLLASLTRHEAYTFHVGIRTGFQLFYIGGAVDPYRRVAFLRGDNFRNAYDALFV